MKIVIIGNSAAGLSALEAFKKIDASSELTVVTKETSRPYSRVLLPYYLRGKVPYEHLFIRDENFFSNQKATCVTGRVLSVDPEEKAVHLADGRWLPYDKLLIATGSSPVRPPIAGLTGSGIFSLWTLNDVKKLQELFRSGKRVAVLGSGFVSLQGACAALSRGLSVTVIELLDRILTRALDERGAGIIADRMTALGIDLHLSCETTHIEQQANKSYLLHFKNSEQLETDFLILGTGAKPNIEFLAGTGIKTDIGILVDDRMETSLPGVYAAGDVAQVPSFAGGDSVVHALWPTAVETGRIAGVNMAGGDARYDGSLNMNVTQMFDLTVASMGSFEDSKGSESWIDDRLPPDHYLKIELKDGIPIGAVCVGSAELVSTLGLLRPLIREKVKLAGSPDKLKSILAQKISQHHRAFVK